MTAQSTTSAPEVPVLLSWSEASRGNIPGTEMGCSQDGHKLTGTSQGTQPSFRRSLAQEWRVIGSSSHVSRKAPVVMHSSGSSSSCSRSSKAVAATTSTTVQSSVVLAESYVCM